MNTQKLWSRYKSIAIFLNGLLFLGGAFTLSAQNTVISTTGVIDSDSTTWANGTWSIAFKPSPSYPNLGQYNINGTPLSASVINQSGSLNGSGTFSATIYQNTAISPGGSSWSLNICPKASSSCGNLIFSTATGTLDLTSAINAILPIVRFNALAGAFGYVDAEAVNTIPVGGTYFNVTLLCQRTYNGSAWSCPSSSALPTSAPLIGTTSGGTAQTITLGTNLSLSGTTLNATGGGSTPPASAPLLGTTSGSTFQPITLGTNLSLSGSTLNATGGGGSLPSVNQPGTTVQPTGAAGAITYTQSGYPTAGNLLSAALLQPYTTYTSVASTCNAITDTNARAACLAQDTATLNLQSAAQNAGLVSSSANPLTGLFTIDWRAAAVPTPGTSTIASLIGTHVLTLSSGSSLVPVYSPGEYFTGELSAGPCANGVAFDVTCQSGITNQNNSLTLTDTTSTSDATCYNTDCTILWVERNLTPIQINTTGAPFSNSGKLGKNLEWEIYPQATSTIADQVGMWNNGTSAWITSNCPAYAYYRNATTLIPSVQSFPGGSLPALKYIWLVYNHTAGTFSCAINDGPLGTATAVTLTATSVGTVTTPTGGAGWEEIAYSPTQISQANRAAYYNSGIAQHAPNYTDPTLAQTFHYQFLNSDLWDVAAPIQYTNGGYNGTAPYRMLWSQAHVRLQTNAPWIAFVYTPGFPAFGGSQATMAAHIDGVLSQFDAAYTLNNNQIFRIQLDGNTHVIEIAQGADQMNGVAPYSSATLYTGISGEYIDGFYAPRGNYTTTILPYGPITSVSVATAGTGQAYGIYTLTSSGCLLPATMTVTVTTGGGLSNPQLVSGGSHCSTPTFTMPTTTGTTGTIAAFTGGTTTTAWVGDSIYSGILTFQSSTDSAIAIQRAGQIAATPTTDSFGDTNTAYVGAGFIKLWDDCSTQTLCNTWYSTQIAALTNVSNVVMTRGANDFGYGAVISPQECLAGWTSSLGYFLNAVQTYTPSAKVWMQAILPFTTESNTDNCPTPVTRTAYRNAESTACSGYAGAGGCAYVDTTVSANGWPSQSNTGDFNADGLHPTSQGHVKLCAGWKNATGSSFPTTCKNPI